MAAQGRFHVQAQIIRESSSMQKVLPSSLLSHSRDKEVLQKSILLRTPLNHPAVPFIVLWSQKSGCTVILKWFLYHAGLLKEAMEYRSGNNKLDIHNYENQVLKAQPSYRTQLIEDVLDDKPVINFIRCPYQRAFSSFMQNNNSGFLRLADKGKTTPGMEVRLDVLRHVYGEETSIDHGFSFVDYLSWLKANMGGELNPHHSPQHTPLYNLLQIRHFRLDDFNTQIHQLEQEFELKTSRSSRELFSSGHHRAKAKMRKNASLDFLRMNIQLGLPHDYRLPTVNQKLLLGTEMGDLVAEIFEADLDLYQSVTPRSGRISLGSTVLY